MKKNNVRCECNCTFEKLTTLGCGGKIYLTLFPESVSQLVFVAKYLYRHKITHCFLGHGSNVLASDDFYNGVAVVTSFVRDFSVQGDTVVASCGMSTSKLCSQLVNQRAYGRGIFRMSSRHRRGSRGVQRRVFRAERAGRRAKAWWYCTTAKGKNFQKNSAVS